jgi:tetratricopeptide (TPR) repeat protein
VNTVHDRSWLANAVGQFVFACVAVSGFGASLSANAQESDWETLNAKAVSLYDQGLYPEAFLAAREAVRVAEQSADPEHAEVAQSLSIIAQEYQTDGYYMGAIDLYRRALASMEKSLGPDHPDVAQIRRKLEACENEYAVSILYQEHRERQQKAMFKIRVALLAGGSLLVLLLGVVIRRARKSRGASECEPVSSREKSIGHGEA